MVQLKLNSGLKTSTHLFLILLAMLSINAGFVVWWGGWSFGPRYLIPALPFLSIPLMFLPRRFIVLLGILTCISLFHMFAAAIGNPFVTDELIWQFVDNELSVSSLPIIGYSPIYRNIIPEIASGVVVFNLGNLIRLDGLASFLPLVAILIFGTAYFRVSEQKNEQR